MISPPTRKPIPEEKSDIDEDDADDVDDDEGEGVAFISRQ
jgi:hypothetical protein